MQSPRLSRFLVLGLFLVSSGLDCSHSKKERPWTFKTSDGSPISSMLSQDPKEQIEIDTIFDKFVAKDGGLTTIGAVFVTSRYITVLKYDDIYYEVFFSDEDLNKYIVDSEDKNYLIIPGPYVAVSASFDAKPSFSLRVLMSSAGNMQIPVEKKVNWSKTLNALDFVEYSPKTPN